MRKLNKLLQLLIRIFILLILILLFASPFKNNNPFNKLSSQNINIYCWLDQSLSMDVLDKGKSLIEIGNSITEYCDSTLPGNIYLYNHNNFTLYDKNTLISTQYNPPSFKEFLSAFKSTRNINVDNSVIMIISDLQNSEEDLLNYLETEDSTLTLLVNVSPQNIDNLSLDSISIIESTDKFIKTHISTKGKIKKSHISLISNRMRQGKLDIIKENINDTVVKFKMNKDLSKGLIKADVNDDFHHDNQLFFSKNTLNIRNVLIIKDNREFSPLSEAIKTILDSSSYKVNTHTPGSYSAEDIENSDIIIINSLNRVAGTLYSIFKPGIFKDKKIIFSPSLKEDAKFINSTILSFLKPKTTITIDTLDSTTSFYIPTLMKEILKDINHLHLRELKVSKSIKPLPGAPLIQIKNSQPLLSTIEDQNQNRWILSATPLDISTNNNITTTGLYIPLIDLLLKYLDITNNYSKKGYNAGVRFRSPLVDPANRFTIQGIYDPDYIKEFSTPFLKISNPGIYELKNSLGEKITLPINPSKKEMILEYKNPKELKTNSNRVVFIRPENINYFIEKLLHGNFEIHLITLLLALILFDLYLSVYLIKKSTHI